MIRLPYGYAIDINDGGGYQFGLLKKTIDKKGVEKEYIYNPIYPSSIERCIQNLYDIKKQEFVKNNDITIKEYIEKIEQLNKEFKEILKNTLKENL